MTIFITTKQTEDNFILIITTEEYPYENLKHFALINRPIAHIKFYLVPMLAMNSTNL